MSSYIDLEELKSKLNPVDVLAFIGYEKSNPLQSDRELRDYCPVHGGDNQRSLSINLDSKVGYCHSQSCNFEGDLISLYSKCKGITDFRVAIEELASKFNLRTEYKELPADAKKKGGYTPEDVVKCWKEATFTGNDTYFSKKKLQPPPIARYGKNPYGYSSILIPLKDVEGRLKGILSIGEKKRNFKASDTIVGAFALLGEINPKGQFYIGEGIATVQTPWEANERKIPAVSCGSCGNIEHVLKAIKKEYPESKPIVLIDIEEGGGGFAAAKAIAAKFPDATFRIPYFEGLPNPKGEKLKDFNDLVSKCGEPLELVKKQLEIEFDIASIAEENNSKKESTSQSERPKATEAFRYLLNNNSEENLIEELKKTSPGVYTGFKIGDEDIKIPGGAISVIAMPTGHGKTATLINYSIGVLNHHSDKSVYFFTYEESGAAIQTLFINTFINKELSKNNRESIKSHFINGNVEHIKTEKREEFLNDKNAFFKHYFDTGRLKVFYSDMPVEELIAAMHFIKNNTDVGLICIDYMQLLRLLKGHPGSRQEELKQICLMLKDCAIATGLPILLGAQFSRQVTMEADLSIIYIREAADIEHIANLTIGGWNRNFAGFTQAGNKDKAGKQVPKEPAIYFEIMKGRGIGSGHNSVLDFNGNTGKISNRISNTKIKPPTGHNNYN